MQKEARSALLQVKTLEQLKQFEIQHLGKKSPLNEILRSLKNLSSEEKKELGPEVQKVSQALREEHQNTRKKLEDDQLEARLKAEWIDVTKHHPLKKGALHPISLVQKQVESIFSSMGFQVADGPEVESEWHNFDALNIPDSHPARDMQDTFWIKSGDRKPEKNRVLRTQTSNMQIRNMREQGVPIRLIAPGRVFRSEDVDASHDAMFYQVEGLLVDQNISLSHLKGTIEEFLSQLFESAITIRLRPGYFPFVEPGLEVDFSCTLCKGEGCRTCKNTGWIEFMGAGMVHPNVLKNCDVDPTKYSGFAFGFGLTRLAMMKYKIDDIRLLTSQKKEFLSQF